MQKNQGVQKTVKLGMDDRSLIISLRSRIVGPVQDVQGSPFRPAQGLATCTVQHEKIRKISSFQIKASLLHVLSTCAHFL